MPKIKTKRSKPPPADFHLVEDTLLELNESMRAAESASTSGLRKDELLWPIHRLHHQRSRYIYEMYYKKHEITKECYDYCVKEEYCDPLLIAKWKKSGFEKLCCLQCISGKLSNYGTMCICRVPKAEIDATTTHVECKHCGCTGCSSQD